MTSDAEAIAGFLELYKAEVCLSDRGDRLVRVLTSQKHVAAIRHLLAENERLKRGDFSKEEIHDICHNLHGTVDARAFADGCAAEQRKLYGCAPDADTVDTLRATLAELNALNASTLNEVDRLKDELLETKAGCKGICDEIGRDRDEATATLAEREAQLEAIALEPIEPPITLAEMKSLLRSMAVRTIAKLQDQIQKLTRERDEATARAERAEHAVDGLASTAQKLTEELDRLRAAIAPFLDDMARLAQSLDKPRHVVEGNARAAVALLERLEYAGITTVDAERDRLRAAATALLAVCDAEAKRDYGTDACWCDWPGGCEACVLRAALGKDGSIAKPMSSS